MSSHVGEAPEAFVFTGESGRNLWRGNFNKAVKAARRKPSKRKVKQVAEGDEPATEAS
ncbi:hypothetical protein [Salinispora arenicola]|uniref:Uncharacterized protein n=1 Tax=Salinispora arenicola TaxID=168697 RepID=A0ABQ4JNX9_SALAC|nr:hypothetical protein [Salinispora arenicola]GIM83760.1 hypothetical protein Sar04_13870 [Salinispora arenicola]